MRWFVNINGRTTGPLEEQDLAQMVREGLVVNAHLRDEAGGAWLELAKSPFARFLPKAAAPATQAQPPTNARAASMKMKLPPTDAGVVFPRSAPSDDPFDHELSFAASLASVAPPKAPEAAPPSIKIPASRPLQPVAEDEDDNLFEREMRLDAAKAPAPAVKHKAPQERAARKFPSVEPPAREEPSTLFKKDELDFDLEGAFDAVVSQRGAPPPAAVPSLSPSISVEQEELDLEADLAPAPAVPPAHSEPAKIASIADVDAALAALEGGPTSDSEQTSSAGDAAVEGAPSKAQAFSFLRKFKRKHSAIGLGAVILGGTLWVGGKALVERYQRAQAAEVQRAAEAQQQLEQAAQREAEAKERAALVIQWTAEAKAKAPGWLTQIEAAKAVTDPALVPPELARIEAIRKESTALRDNLGTSVPVELATVVAAATATTKQLQNIVKAQQAVGSAMDWLREIQLASVTSELLKIPAEIARVKKIQGAAEALATELGAQVPVELSSVAPAASTALELLENSQRVQEAVALAEKDVVRGKELADKLDWIAADKAYQDGQAVLDKVVVTKDNHQGPVPPEADLANAKARIVNARGKIAHAVTQEIRRLELERKQREQEEEVARKAAAYRARCGNAPNVSPFDGQLFGLKDALKKASSVDPGPFTIAQCTHPEMTKNDCWVSTCDVAGKIFGNDFRRKFAFSQAEGFKQLK